LNNIVASMTVEDVLPQKRITHKRKMRVYEY